jgi:hypothetical protein
MSAVSLEQGVLAHCDLHKQIPWWAAGRACFTLAAEANAIPGIHTGWDLDGQRLGFFDQTLTSACTTGIRDRLPSPSALWTRLLNLKKALLDPHLPTAATTAAGDRSATWFSATAITRVTVLERRDFDFCCRAAHGLF